MSVIIAADGSRRTTCDVCGDLIVEDKPRRGQPRVYCAPLGGQKHSRCYRIGSARIYLQQLHQEALDELTAGGFKARAVQWLDRQESWVDHLRHELKGGDDENQSVRISVTARQMDVYRSLVKPHGVSDVRSLIWKAVRTLMEVTRA